MAVEGARPRTGSSAARGGARPRLRRAIAVGTLALGVAGAGAGIGLAFRPASVRGHVVEVVARDIGHAATVTVRDLDGQDHRLDVDDAVDMTPAHLREHMTSGEPVTATLGAPRAGGSRPVVVRIVDGLR